MGKKVASFVEIRVSKAAAVAIGAGHPWFFKEGPTVLAPGEVAVLRGPDGRVCGWGLADEGTVALRVLGRGEPPEQPLSEVIADRVRRADALRTRIAPAETDCWRVVNGAGDGLPEVVVDRYGDLAVLRLYGGAWEPHLDALVAAIARLPWCAAVMRRLGVERVDGEQGAVVLHGEEPADRLVVHENGMAMVVRPRVGQKTGLFLDQREHRAWVRRLSSGRRVANLFAYTGGFSVAAALGGAAHVISVDIAPDAIADAEENFRLNGLDPAAHAFEVADAFRWDPRTKLDLVVVDPPSLAKDRSAEAAARAAYRGLHRRLGNVISRDGLLATSSCTARLSMHDWRNAVAEGLSAHGQWSWLWCSGEPPDHPTALAHREARYLKFAVLRRL